MGADYLASEPGIDQVRHPADVIDMGVGQEQIIYLSGWDRKLGKGQYWVIGKRLAHYWANTRLASDHEKERKGRLPPSTAFLAPSLQLSLNPYRMAAHWQYRDNIGNFIHDIVIDGIRKSLGKHSVKTILPFMNACVNYQGLDIGQETIPKIITNTGFSLIIEGFFRRSSHQQPL